MSTSIFIVISVFRNLEKNNLTGPVPVGLIQKSNDGSLTLRCVKPLEPPIIPETVLKLMSTLRTTSFVLNYENFLLKLNDLLIKIKKIKIVCEVFIIPSLTYVTNIHFSASLCENQNLNVPLHCGKEKKKDNVVVPVAASVVGIIILLTIVAAVIWWRFKKKRNHGRILY